MKIGHKNFVQIVLALLFLAATITTCSDSGKPTVVVYTSMDQVFSEPILRDFETKSGIKVKAVYDIEATKTTGLVNRILAESGNPQADVFWNGEFVQTLMLKEKGLLQAYRSPNANAIAEGYRDVDGCWTAFSFRARVMLVNTKLLKPVDYPASIFDLTRSKWISRGVAIAYPLFGTTATHAAAIYALLGRENGRKFFERMHSSGVTVVAGNSVVRDMVVSGKVAVGLTDTDDACGAIRGGAPVKTIFPDQGKNEIGTLLIPGTVALIKNCPHPETGKKLMDYILESETEQKLLETGWACFPLHTHLVSSECFQNSAIKRMKVNPDMVFEHFIHAMKDLRQVFIK